MKIPKSYNEIEYVTVGSKTGLSKTFRSGNSFLREECALTWLAHKQKTFEVPSVLKSCLPAIVLEFVEHTAPPSEESAWHSFGAALAELHSFRFDGSPEVFPDDSDMRSTIHSLLEKANERFPLLKTCAKKILELGTKVDPEALKASSVIGFSHRDPNRGNFFFSDNSIFLVDFEHCHPLGDIREDLVLAEIHSGRYWRFF